MKLFYCLILLFSTFHLKSQNLVENCNFESYSQCPTNQGDIKFAFPWYGYPYTTDFFNSCNGGNYVGVPHNGPGTQEAFSGKGYAGIIATKSFEGGTYDLLMAPLREEMEAGADYFVSFYVAGADQAHYATDDIGIYITVEEPSTVIDNAPVEPAIRNPPGKILPNNQWTQISGIYTAKGGEKYITIGSVKDKNITKEPVNPHSFLFEAGINYYYVDYVVITKMGGDENRSPVILVDTAWTCDERFASLQLNRSNNSEWVWSNGEENEQIYVKKNGTYAVVLHNLDECEVREDSVMIDFVYQSSLFNKVTPTFIRDFASIHLISLDTRVLDVEILSMSGQTLYKIRQIISRGINVVKLDFSSMAPGIYFVRSSHKCTDEVTKVVVAR